MAIWSRSASNDIQARIEDVQTGLGALAAALGEKAEEAGEQATRRARAAQKSASSTAGDLASALTPVASDLRHQIEALASIFSAATGGLAKKAGNESKHAYKAVEERVEDNAMLAVVAAAGVGFLLGVLFMRGSSED